jgi:hypothetical protein
VVPGVAVEEVEQVAARHGVNDLVNPRQPWGSFRINVEAVLDQLPGHSWQVRWLPREDVTVRLEEVYERVFLFGVEAGPDGGGLAAVTCPEVNCLD